MARERLALLALLPGLAGCWLYISDGEHAARKDVSGDDTSVDSGDTSTDDTGCVPVDEACDGDDNDCDGSVDEDALDAALWYPDADGDGYLDAEGEVRACEQPDGYAQGEKFDCDDSDPAISPDALEACEDEIDNDCSGEDDLCRLSGVRRLLDGSGGVYGAEDGTRAGTSAAVLGDLNGDGDGDLVVTGYEVNASNGSAQAYAWLFLGQLPPTLLTSDANMSFSAPGVSELVAAQMFDLDGDSYDDVALGVDDGGNGAVVVLLGDVTVNWEADAVRLTGAQDGMQLGAALSGLKAWRSDDTYGDFVVGAPGYTESGAGGAGIERGMAFVVEGPPPDGETGVIDLFDIRILGPDDGEHFGEVVAGVPDVDGDGLDEIAILGQTDTEEDFRGRVSVIYGGSGAAQTDFPVTSSEAQITAVLPDTEFGAAIAGVSDTNCDGYGDLLIGDPEALGGGAVYLFLGPVAGDLQPDDAYLKAYGEAPGWRFGESVAGRGDLSGDGCADIAIGSPGAEIATQEGGAVFLFHGGFDEVEGGAIEDLENAAQAVATANDEDEEAGAFVQVADLDRDGYSDLLVGSPGYTSSGLDERGALFILLGGLAE